ncbi:MAG TPA: DUF72 domain-containing protein [Candidatus Binatus sp.]|nr:DUF72 domain-containing protein [Candidatus Binatus sp.]
MFYPRRGRRRVDELEFYAGHFNAVEINSTFYRPASAAMARAWVSKTPADFVFTVKAWQKFTHPAKLGGEAAASKEPWEPFDKPDVERFTAGIYPLLETGRLGALLFQYPASFACDSVNLERLEVTLSAFDMCPKVVELRHRSWSDRYAETAALLARSRATWAFIDEPKFAESVKQELSARDDLAYLRLHGRNRQKWWNHQDGWERYDYFYQADNIRRLAERLKQLSGNSTQKKFYVFFNNHARAQAVANGLMLKMALAPAAICAIPTSLIEAFPELANFQNFGG